MTENNTLEEKFYRGEYPGSFADSLVTGGCATLRRKDGTRK